MRDEEQTDDSRDPLALALGRQVARYRETRDWRIVDLAERSGMSDKYVWRVEAGEVLPGLRNLVRLAQALGVPLAVLVDGVDATPIEPRNRSYVAERKPGRPPKPRP
ncbi:helix-turn-helix domain-containing protein [Sphingomonas corticis]|uniref:Helix-turn-helix transcriptional regulator n=1 Tax=Sphingomonas corticis TaxID=2722791 RepID=A0ABX1CUS3_9SPHN|nr:helix-turn-helix transcriptional regulator [Sphingomonas corticis]NJR80050.1 helix-turn-helix transcriptional regulator [Sphingomonas corticis]